MKPSLVLIVATLLAVASFSHAQTQPTEEENTCDAMVIADMLHGEYLITAGPLQMKLAGAVLYPEGKVTDAGTIYPGPLRNYMVKMASPIPEFRLVEADALEPDWRWDAAPADSSGPAFYMSSADLETLVGCEIGDMPRFEGNFQTTSQQGDQMDHTIRLVMAMPDWLIGSWRWKATTGSGPVTGLRYVIFDRTTPVIGQ